MPSRLWRLERFMHETGHSYVCELPPGVPEGDAEHRPDGSLVELFEDGTALGPAHSLHDDIRHQGGGRYSHWNGHLYFSASDNSNPGRNRRRYEIYVPASADDRRHGRAGVGPPPARQDLSAWDAYGVAESLFYEVFPHAFVGEFGKACWDDREFVADYERLVPGNRRSFERKYVVSQLVGALKQVPGDLAECGVYNAATAFFMAKAAAASGVSRELHLFDSFHGLSAPGMEDGSYWQAGALSMPEAVAREHMRPFPGVTFHPGWIPERFGDVADRRFAFVHIDVDLYAPTLDSVRFFYPRMPAGGMLVCDDYGFTTCPGAAQAMREFFADKPETVVHLPTGQGLVIRV